MAIGLVFQGLIEAPQDYGYWWYIDGRQSPAQLMALILSRAPGN
jgi:hypothetical protein